MFPFVDYSPGQENTYITNGLTDDILDKLHKFQDLRVKSGTDSDKYRDSKKHLEIAKELGVNNIVKGSGQKIGEIIELRI